MEINIDWNVPWNSYINYLKIKTMNPTTQLQKELDLRKDIVLSLKKSKGIEGLKAQVILALDFSSSMDLLYRNGHVQELVERLLPLGLAFDSNGEVDFYLFHHNFIKMKENITSTNVNNYINDKVYGKYMMGSTNYAPVIGEILKDFTVSNTHKEVKTRIIKGGFFSRNKTEQYEEIVKSFIPLKEPIYVIFITDGNNDDQYQSREIIKEAAKAGIFIQFVGIGNQSFSFLKELDTMTDRVIDNANFFKVSNLSEKTDQELYDLLLNEFPGFIPEAKAKGLLL